MLRHVRTGDEGRPLPEVLYGRRKMTAWLARNGFPDVSKHTVDRLMRDEDMNRLVPRPQRPDHSAGQDRRRPSRRPAQPGLHRTAAQPRVGHRLHLRPDLVRLRLRRVRDRPVLEGDRGLVSVDYQRRRLRRAVPGDGPMAT